MTDQVVVSVQNHIGYLHLNRPNALNALSLEMIRSISESLKKWQNDDNIKAVIITGEGDTAFCAGGDIRAVYQSGPENAERSLSFFKDEYTMNSRIFHFNKPYIALLHGISMGGGLGVSLHGSIKVAANNLILAMPETGIGFFTDIGSSYFLSRLPNGLGNYLALTGARISAALAKHIGLIDAVIDINNLETLRQQLKSENIKDVIASFEINTQLDQHEQQELEIGTLFNQSSVADIVTALSNSDHPLAEQTLQTMRKKCPLSVMVTFELLQRANILDLDQCLALDYQLVAHFLKNPNFYEGIRAAVVDKDQSPRWQPDRLEAVSDATIVAFFGEG